MFVPLTLVFQYMLVYNPARLYQWGRPVMKFRDQGRGPRPCGPSLAPWPDHSLAEAERPKAGSPNAGWPSSWAQALSPVVLWTTESAELCPHPHWIPGEPNWMAS